MRLPDNINMGFGCDQLGGHNWGKVDPGEIMAAIPLALDRGIRLFDTADCYGNGTSETRLGQALGQQRDKALIASKFGVRIDAHGKVKIDNDPAWIRQALEASLARLNTDRIDLYQLHWWDKLTPIEDIFGTLEDLRREGLINAYGATNVEADNLVPILAAGETPGFASYSCEFSLVFPERRAELNKICGDPEGASFLSWGSLGGGILSGKYTSTDQLDPSDRRLKREDSHFAGNGLVRALHIIDALGEIAEEIGSGVSHAHVALAWIRATLGYGIGLVGVKSSAQLLDLLPAFEISLTDDQVNRLDRLSKVEAP